jgi:acyl-coenzyme A synthetase/AMP-(fatty) acid ligase
MGNYAPLELMNDAYFVRRMMFNTGDLGRWLENGELEHLGRQDDQVKIKGCRVELDGVSATIEELPWVEKACALKIGEELWAFYSTHDSGIGEEEVLKQHLRSSLNHYAQPTKLVHVVSMPLTPIGKIDKRALKEIKNGEIESSHTSKRASNTITVMPYDPNIDIRVKPESLRAEAVPS